MPEQNGLGGPLCQQLTRAMQERSAALGGGVRRRAVVLIDPTAGLSWERQIEQQTGVRRAPWWDDDRPAVPPPVVIRPVPVSAELKAAAYGTLRLLVHRGWLLLPASATELLRELRMLKVELTASGLERIETGGRDFASALMLAGGPYRDRGRFRSVLLELCEQWARLPPSTVPSEIEALATVSTGGGVSVPRAPVWAGVTDDAVTLPAGVVLGTAPTPEDRETEAMRERVWRMVNEQQEAVNGGKQDDGALGA